MASTRLALVVLVVAAAAALPVPGGGAEPRPDAGEFQHALDRGEWSWADHEEGIFYSMSQSGFAYQIELVRPPGGQDRLTIRFVNNAGKAVWAWDGHSRSVFVQAGGILVYALFHPSTQGCTLVGVDLDAGREVWRNELTGVPKGAHSGYNNRVTMHAGPDGTVVVKGNESFGRYVEMVDVKTGKTLAHRVFKEARR